MVKRGKKFHHHFKKRGRPVGSRKRSKKYIPHLLKGMKDILPEEQKYFDFVLDKTKEVARAYGFEKVTLPLVEELNLFKRGVGLTTDIFQRELFNFNTPSGQKVCLRPEGTASSVRAYLEHGFFNLPQPVKLFYDGPMFRYEKIETGKQREFYQIGLEVIGSSKSVIDAQLILLVSNLLQNLGLKHTIQINNLGCEECRKIYQRKLTDFIKQKFYLFCKDCRRRARRSPLRLFECHTKSCRDIFSQAPHLVDFLCEECRSQFIKTLELLDEARVVYNLNLYLVRGMAYHDKTIFEFWPIRPNKPKEIAEKPVDDKTLDKKDVKTDEKVKSQIEEEIDSRSALAGGGRYDRLVKALGGQMTPMCGVALGLERIVDEMKKNQVKLPKTRTPQVFVAQIGDLARQNALRIFEIVRKEGFRVAENLSQDSLRNQLDIANKLGVKYCLILGQQEVLHKTIIIRDMNSGSQETIDQEKILKELRKRL